jgi:hypothetical protein
MIPAKAADESTIRLLLAVPPAGVVDRLYQRLSACEPLESDDAFDRE